MDLFMVFLRYDKYSVCILLNFRVFLCYSCFVYILIYPYLLALWYYIIVGDIICWLKCQGD